MIAPAVELFLAAWLVFLGTGALLSAALIRLIRRRVLHWAPRSRHHVLLWLSGLPVLLAGVLMASATLPAWLSLELPGFDHCESHETHPHLCFTHLPHSNMRLVATLLLASVLLAALFKASNAVWRLLQARRLMQLIQHAGTWRADVGALVLDARQPFCFAAGLFRPEIVLSDGLVRLLSPAERQVVVEHERAHVRRRDALLGNVANLLLCGHLPHVARFLRAELELATEQACDEAAADAVGDRVTVAETILAVQRAVSCSSFASLAPVASSFGRCSSERRVMALLADRIPERSTSLLFGILLAVASGLLVVSAQLHHLIESFLFSIAY